MAIFDPDLFLQQTSGAPSGGFDPDAFLQETHPHGATPENMSVSPEKFDQMTKGQYDQLQKVFSNPHLSDSQKKLVAQSIYDPFTEQRNLSGQVLSPQDFTTPGEPIPKEGGVLNFMKYNVAHFQPMNKSNLLGMAASTRGVSSEAAAAPDITPARKIFDPFTKKYIEAPTVEAASENIGSGPFTVRATREGMAPTEADLRAARAAASEHAHTVIDYLKDLVLEHGAHALGLPPGVMTALKKAGPMAINGMTKAGEKLQPLYESAESALPRAAIPAAAAFGSRNNGDEK